MFNNSKKNLIDKRILLISLSGYHQGIINQMRDLGAKVDYINDKPNDGVICKTLGRLQLRFYQRIIAKYYYKKIDELKDQDYNYILIIRGEYTPCLALEKLKETFPNAKLILYMWDGLNKQNTKGIQNKWHYFDKVYTFDRFDYENNKDRISFLPLFYYNEYLPTKIKDANSLDFKYDVSFIGTGHADRVKIVKEIIRQCNSVGMKTFSFFYIPHILIYLKEKITNPYFKGVKKSDVSFNKMPFKDLYDIYTNTQCVIDVEHPGQHGLTMRSIEIVGLRRKLITTNRDVVNYDFYNPNNIFIVDRNKPIIDMTFFDKPYNYLQEDVYMKYSLENWIIQLLS